MFERFKESFDPETLIVLGQAFDLAWDFIERSHSPEFADPDEGRYKLASTLVTLAQSGETNKIVLANKAIWGLREAERSQAPKAPPIKRIVQRAIWPAGRPL